MNYYGVDWLSRAVIAWAIFELPKRPRRATIIFASANVFSVALGFLAEPHIWGTIVGDTIFFAMHLRNLRKWSK